MKIVNRLVEMLLGEDETFVPTGYCIQCGKPTPRILKLGATSDKWFSLCDDCVLKWNSAPPAYIPQGRVTVGTQGWPGGHSR